MNISYFSKHTCAFFLFLIPFVALYGQPSRIKGQITDADSGEPIPYANIYIKGTSAGTIADDSGYFKLETHLRKDSITATFLGYQALSKAYKYRATQVIDFQLRKATTTLDEVVVKPGENPAHKILRSIWEQKKLNRLKRQNVHCQIYNKLQMKLSNIDEKFKNRKILQPFQFVFENVDTNHLNGKTYLPILISESVSDYYHQKDPTFDKEVIRGTKVSGINNESIREFISGINQSFDPLDDYMLFYNESGFVSPFSESGLLFYRYYIVDSTEVNGEKEYTIKFRPRRKQERTFFGHFIVSGKKNHLKSLTMDINPEANLNYITEFKADYQFDQVNDSLWLLKKEHLLVDFNLVDSKNLKGLQGEKTTIYTDFEFNKPIPEAITGAQQKVIYDENANNEKYIDEKRPEQLTRKEEKIYEMVDSIKNVPAFRTTYDIIKTIFDAHYDFGKFKIGPYFTIYSYNKVEGHRFRFGGTTTIKLSERIKFTGYTAYGTLDQKFKYYANTIYVFSNTPRITLTGIYRHDVSQLNLEPGALLNDNIVSSFLRRNPFTKLHMIDNFIVQFETDITSGITSQIKFNNMRVFPGPYIPFINPVTGSSVDHLDTKEITASLHFESGQKFFRSKFKRLRIPSNHPALDFSVTSAPSRGFGNNYHYWKFRLALSQYLPTNPFGYNNYVISACRTRGTAPWPLLEVMGGNETYGLFRYDYNMMNYYEFVADSYVSIVTEQHLQGMILNYIPLLRKLKFREVLSLKAVAGKITDKNSSVLQLPEYMHSLNKPYVEVGLGVENILKIIRIDALWRVTHKDNPDIQIFGVRARFQFML